MTFLRGLFLFFILFFAATSSKAQFKLHLNNDLHNTNPNLQKSGASSYVLFNLHRSLLKIDKNGELVPDLAENCHTQKKTITCTLRQDSKWSDGSLLTAEDFLETYRNILTPSYKSPRADLLFAVKGAQEFYQGKGKGKGFAITAPNPRTIKFELNSVDSDFKFNLANFILAPYKVGKFTGPFKIKKIEARKSIELMSNDFYWQKNPSRPEVHFLIIEEDSTALNLYEKNQLHFLRRLPTALIAKYQNRADYFSNPIWRMDYLGFLNSPQLNLETRKSLATSLRYKELQKIFNSKGLPGCPGIPDDWYGKDDLCLNFIESQNTAKQSISTFEIAYSASGGDDHRRAMEWVLLQWKKNLGVSGRVKAVDNKLFIEQLKNNQHLIFRRGLPLDSPNCYSSLKFFISDHPENFIRLSSPEFDEIVAELKASESDIKNRELCAKGIKFLKENYHLIFLGPIEFSSLAKKDYTGWSINPMNLLDLSELKPSVSK
ncbi:MAG: ABC transporter substrate-binding protein [Bdellovibrionia bacterium]